MRSARARGFTLLELMTSVVITIIILLAVAASFTAVQTIYQREARLKSSVESARVAAGYIERVTKYIGYGIDPRYAIDIDASNLPGTVKSNLLGVNFNNITTTATNAGFVTDDFAFRYRDPDYLRRGTYDGSSVTLDSSAGGPATFNMVLQPGRLIQVVCTGGVIWTVVKTSAATSVAGTSVAAATANVPADPTSFPTPPSAASAPCLTLTGPNAPYVMLVREVRLRIIPLGTAPNIRPYLVAYPSISVASVAASADFDPIAADVESFQVSYMMNKDTTLTPTDGAGGDWILGNAIADATILPTAAGTRPTYELGYSDPLRFNSDVANVRAVVFDLSTRSMRPEARSAFPQPRLADDALAAAASDGYFHVSVSTTVRTPNLASRTMFTPTLRSGGDNNPLNEWGG